MLKIFNTLSRQIEEFKPLNPPKIGIYACGPTVYDHIHIGNYRSFIFYDVLRRLLISSGFEVKFIQNLTDIEDKIVKRAAEKKITPKELTEEYTKYFFEDLGKLNIDLADVHPKATEHIGAMIKYIESLLEKGLAYVEKDGSVYFDISEFKDYGKLSKIEKKDLMSGKRNLSDEYTKDDVQDFALWKSIETDEFGWDSPWGKGRPGWHIECSVMSQEYLGDTLDIHLGGIDLLFPHHENEIAQSEGKTGKPFAKYFIHGEHLLVDGKKMSKSLNNFYTFRDIEEKEIDPIAFRYLLLTAHYRDKLNFTWESLTASQNALNNLRSEISNWPVSPHPSPLPEGEGNDKSLLPLGEGQDEGYYFQFLEALNNDLNTPQGLAILWKMVKDKDYPIEQKSVDILAMDQVLGLKLDEYLGKNDKLEIPEEVQILVDQREKARESKDFEKSDQLRGEIKKLGFEVLDTSSGQTIRKI